MVKSRQAMILEAQARKIQIAQKQRKLQDSGYVTPQRNITLDENRLINMGHYAKSSQGARLDYLREKIRIERTKNRKQGEIVLVKK